MSEAVMRVGDRLIGRAHSPFIIAEMSGNHNGDIKRAFALIAAAKAAGADAVKLQTYTADTMTIDCSMPDFQIQGGPWHGRSLYDLYREAGTPWEWHEALFAKGRELGITVFSTPFDQSAVHFLESLDNPVYKIASFELTDHDLISAAAATGRPLILSTGLGTLGEIGEAVRCASRGGRGGLALLHCVSGYPTPASDANLRTMVHLGEMFGAIVGLSDHTLGVGVSIAAVALGASVIEKHLTLRRADGGPDATFSLEPDEFTALVRECRAAYDALGRITYDIMPSEEQNRHFRRSLYVVENIAAGERFTATNVRCIRPGYGLAPKYRDIVLGRTAAYDLKRGTALSWSMVVGNALQFGD